MTTDELIELTRTILVDFSTPKKWADELIVSRLNEAQKKTCRTLKAYIDDTVQVDLAADTDTYELDRRVFHVFNAHVEGSVLALSPTTKFFLPISSQVGVPTTYVTDSRARSIRLWPAPAEDGVLLLRAALFPMDMSADDGDIECGLDEEYQPCLPDWAAFRCFSDDDADGRSDGAAKLAKDRYDSAVRQYKRDLYQFRVGSATHVSGYRVR